MQGLDPPKPVANIPSVLPGLVLFSVSVLGTRLELGLVLGIALAAIGWALRVPRWWVAMIVIAPMLQSALDDVNLHANIYLLFFLALVAVFGLHFLSRVPVFPSQEVSVDMAADLLPSGKYQEILDLGAGTGGAVRKFQARSSLWHVHGCEQALGPWLVGWWVSRQSNLHYSVRWGRFESESWATADLVYAYLSSAAMPRVFQRAEQQLKEGALLVSNEFQVPFCPGTPITHCVEASNALCEIYVWRKQGGRLVPIPDSARFSQYVQLGAHA